jgi:hypothetical protein
MLESAARVAGGLRRIRECDATTLIGAPDATPIGGSVLGSLHRKSKKGTEDKKNCNCNASD